MKDNLNLLVVGSGGREHAIAKKLLESSHVEHVYVAPGNIGMESEGISTVAIEETDFDALKGFMTTESNGRLSVRKMLFALASLIRSEKTA